MINHRLKLCVAGLLCVVAQSSHAIDPCAALVRQRALQQSDARRDAVVEAARRGQLWPAITYLRTVLAGRDWTQFGNAVYVIIKVDSISTQCARAVQRELEQALVEDRGLNATEQATLLIVYWNATDRRNAPEGALMLGLKAQGLAAQASHQKRLPNTTRELCLQMLRDAAPKVRAQAVLILLAAAHLGDGDRSWAIQTCRYEVRLHRPADGRFWIVVYETVLGRFMPRGGGPTSR